jgi:hypothetical protein
MVDCFCALGIAAPAPPASIQAFNLLRGSTTTTTTTTRRQPMSIGPNNNRANTKRYALLDEVLLPCYCDRNVTYEEDTTTIHFDKIDNEPLVELSTEFADQNWMTTAALPVERPLPSRFFDSA